MRWLRGIKHRVLSLLGRNRAAEELDEEIQYHIDLDIEKNIAAGMSAADARRQALLQFGNIENAKEEVRDESGVRWMEDLMSDVRFALRGLRKTPVFTAAALISLGVGIGANTAIFSVVNGVLLQPLPYPDSDRLYSAFVDFPDFDAPFSAADFLRIEEAQEDVASLAAYDTHGFTLTTPDGPEIVRGAWVTSAFFEVLGISPNMGRAFAPDDEAAVVVNYDFWQTQLAGTNDVLARFLELDGELFAIAGVLPPDFQLPRHYESKVLALLRVDEPPRRGPFHLRGLVRLADGVSPQVFQQHLQTAKDRTDGLYPEGSNDWRYGIRPLKETVVGNADRMLVLLLSAVGCVLLIAVANVANLLLARGAVRQGEVALRSALGANRGRIVRQMLTESAVLGMLGASLGLGLAWLGVEVLGTAASSFVPRMNEVAIDRWVLGFALCVGLVSGTIIGIVPTFNIPWKRLSQSLTTTGRGGFAGANRGVIRKTLVISEFALALTVLLASGLLIRSMQRLQSVDLGFEDDGIAAILLSLPSDPYESEEEFDAFFSNLELRLQSIAGVASMGYSTAIPPDRLGMTNNYTVEGEEPGPNGGQPTCPWLTANESYFGTLEIPLRQGRIFNASDQPGAVVVSEEFARFHFPGKSAIGKRLKGGAWDAAEPWLTIVGVVGDAPYTGVGRETHRTVYLPYHQAGRYRFPWVVVRLDGEAETLLPQIRRELVTLDARVPIFTVATMNEMVRESTSTERSLSLLFSVLAVVALVLAATGIYGVVSYHVTKRRRDFAIRRALGAPNAGVVGGVLKEGLVLAAFGVLLGCGGAYLLARGLSSLLFEISPTDVTTFVTAALTLTAVAVVACLIPSLRASRVDPVSALREE